ncbi:MAG: hypothetical protein C0402_03880 [Thermodesulfovibrio sp.]|nr:hypothetical protein [Thermodesulfovibrio sp.]
MKLAKPVRNESGMILLGENTELSDSLIQRLEKMSIENVSIIAEAQDEKPPEELLAELSERFKKTENEPYMALIKRLFEEQIKGVTS